MDVLTVFEPEYTDEELLERRMQKQREEQLAISQSFRKSRKEACES